MTRTVFTVDWQDPDKLRQLRDCAAAGMTATQIAGMIGGGCTRNSVLGVARRRGVTLLTESTQALHKRRVGLTAPEPDPPPPAAPAAQLPVVLSDEALQAIVATHPAFVGSRAPAPSRSCQWPVGDPQARGFHFCGARTVPGKSYCQEHRAIANTPSKPYDPDASRKVRGPFRASQVGQWS